MNTLRGRVCVVSYFVGLALGCASSARVTLAAGNMLMGVAIGAWFWPRRERA